MSDINPIFISIVHLDFINKIEECLASLGRDNSDLDERRSVTASIFKSESELMIEDETFMNI